MTLVIAAVAAIAATAVTISPTVLFLVSGATRRAHSIATMSLMFLSKAHNMAQRCACSEAQAHSKPIGLRFVHVVARTIAHPMSIVVARTIAHSMRSTVVACTVACSMARAMAHHWPTWVATMLMAMARAVAHHSRFGFVTLLFLVVRLFVSRARVRSWFLVSITIVIELFAFFFVALH